MEAQFISVSIDVASEWEWLVSVGVVSVSLSTLVTVLGSGRGQLGNSSVCVVSFCGRGLCVPVILESAVGHMLVASYIGHASVFDTVV